ncbi:MAG: hypothetical protein AAB446_01355 [Patescibacteria group bacterium]
MNKQKFLVGITGIWLLVNLPIIPFAGSLVIAFLSNNSSDIRVPFAILSFSVFSIVFILNRCWFKKYTSLPVFLTFIIFIFSTLSLQSVNKFMSNHFYVGYGLLVAFFILCIMVVIEAMHKYPLFKKNK